ncbi:unnamed protein product [Brassica rapa subsp. trilocularis]
MLGVYMLLVKAKDSGSLIMITKTSLKSTPSMIGSFT